MSTSCTVNTTKARKLGAIRYPISSLTKYRANRPAGTVATISSEYSPSRANAMASASRSEANICNLIARPVAMIASWHTIAIEYASSPVLQPATHMRSAWPAWRFSIKSGMITLSKRSNTLGSRKKLVTLINMSWASRSRSAGLWCKRSRYPAKSPGKTASSPIRRSIRRPIVPGLYWLKSCDVVSFRNDRMSAIPEV